MLADLRDSASQEHVARQVRLLYWPAKVDSNANPNEIVCTIAKNSDGGTGRVTLYYDPRIGRIADTGHEVTPPF